VNPQPLRAECQRRQQPVHVDDAVGHTAHRRIARQVIEFVDIDRSRHQAGQLRWAASLDQGEEPVSRYAQPLEDLRELTAAQMAFREPLVMRQTGFFERVRERVMTDVVQERGQPDPEPFSGIELTELRHGPAR